METANYFIEYELVKIKSLAERLNSSNYPTIDMEKIGFNLTKLLGNPFFYVKQFPILGIECILNDLIGTWKGI